MRKRIVAAVLSIGILFTGIFGTGGTIVQAASNQEYTESVRTKEQQADQELPTGLLPVEKVKLQTDEVPQEAIYKEKSSSNIKKSAVYQDSFWDKYNNYYFYNQMSEDERELYDRLDNVCREYLLTAKDAVYYYGAECYGLPLVMIGGLNWDEASSIMQIFRYANPQYYFLNNVMLSGTDERNRNVVTFGCYRAFAGGKVRVTETQKVRRKLESWGEEIQKESTPMKKVQRAHDLICNQVTYNDAFINGTMNEETAFSQSAYSVFCRKSTVCAGYALAFEMLCNGAGIDTVAVTSYDHAWNKVRLDDSWYNVDLTWDDTDQVIYYDFFVRNDAFYASVILADSHKEEKMWEDLVPRCTLDSNPPGSIVPGSMTLGSTAPGNLPVITGQTEEPLISISKDNFVTLSCAEANADIYYSLDGSSPMPSFSKCYKYQGPFQIEGKVKVQAAAVCDTYKDSGVVSSDERDIPIIRKIFFNGNGAASGKMETIERYKVGESGALPANTYKRTGYVYIGWNTRADGSGTPYEDGLPVMSFRRPVTTSVTLYAQWDPIRYTITYHLNGGKNSSWNPAAYYVTDAVVLYNPTRKGYTFQGWYQDSSYKVRVEGIKAGSIGNKTLYAKWTPNKYSIVFKGNKNTSGKMSALKSRTYDVSYRLSANKFKRKGYTFTGWNTKSNGKGKKYSNKQKVKNLTSAAHGKVTLYAQWKKKKYTITYKLKGGKNSRKNPTAYYYTTRTVKLKNPTRKGYTFKGWYADKKYKKKVTQIKKGTTGNKILYAKWKRK